MGLARGRRRSLTGLVLLVLGVGVLHQRREKFGIDPPLHGRHLLSQDGDEGKPPDEPNKNPVLPEEGAPKKVSPPDEGPKNEGAEPQEVPPPDEEPKKEGVESKEGPPPDEEPKKEGAEPKEESPPDEAAGLPEEKSSTICPSHTPAPLPPTQPTHRKHRTIHVPVKLEDNVTCLPPAYHEFPPDLFNNQQREQGAVVVHVLVGLYMFYALAVVCDVYFVNALERICEAIGLSEDVAGATFMAAGSSAPELFASILGVFVAKGDVGTGTIVGSAVFNILFVVGACSLLAGQAVDLSWWPLLRDSGFYALTVIILISVMADGSVTWWEALIMLLMYGVYIIIMKFNVQLRSWLTSHTSLRMMDDIAQSSRGILDNNLTGKVHSSYVQFSNDANMDPMDHMDPSLQPSFIPPDECIRDYRRRWTVEEFIFRLMMLNIFRPKTRFQMAGKLLIMEMRRQRKEASRPCAGMDFPDGAAHKDAPSTDIMGGPDEWKRVPTMGDGLVSMVLWGITLPVRATLYYTIPNCSKDRWERWFLLTFFNSMLWIAIFSYILVWMVTLVGYTCGIPDSIMGITFLAAGTSVPDALSSLIVVRQGQGDMAVSNSIGSNVFDVLIGLAFPWFLQTAVVMPGSSVYINSRGMVYNVMLLFLSIGATITAIHKNGWQLNPRLGVILLVVYVIFLIFSILIEYNVFGFVNPPECKE